MKRTGLLAAKRSSSVPLWQKRPSDIRGYKTCYYLTDKKKDYIRVDVNPKDRRVRLYIEVFKQNGCPYFSTVADGKIITEKNMRTMRSPGSSGVFLEKASIVSTIPDLDVVALFEENYGIKSPEFLKAREDEKKKLLKETKERYFKKESVFDGDTDFDTDEVRRYPFLKDLLIGTIDVFLGAALSAASFFTFGYSFTALGVCSAFYGIILGAVDFFIMDRAPNVFKLLLFLFAGLISYIYGYYLI